jgi:hypothetical protein
LWKTFGIREPISLEIAFHYLDIVLKEMDAACADPHDSGGVISWVLRLHLLLAERREESRLFDPVVPMQSRPCAEATLRTPRCF